MIQIFTLYRGIFTERFRVFHAEDGQKKAAAFGEAAAGIGRLYFTSRPSDQTAVML